MKKWLVGAVIGVLVASFTLDADAQRRLGGGRNFGRQSPTVQQRQAQPPQAPPQSSQQAATPAQPATAGAPAAGAATAAKAASPWKGALMGLAAGLGLAALASWLGFGDTLATIMLFALVGLAIFMVLGFFLRRASGARPAYEGAGGASYSPSPSPSPPSRRVEPQPLRRETVQTPEAVRPGSAMDEFTRGAAPKAEQAWGVPAGFDTEGFLAHAKIHFGKLQAAWDAGDVDALSEFMTNEMFTSITHELRARAGASKTEIVALDARLLGIESSTAEHLASVRFTGSLRVDGALEPVDEAWNLVKPVDGKTGWLLAGIQQMN